MQYELECLATKSEHNGGLSLTEHELHSSHTPGAENVCPQGPKQTDTTRWPTLSPVSLPATQAGNAERPLRARVD